MQRGLEDLAFLPRKVVGFIAPAWLLGANAEIAIRKLGFLYTTRLGRVQTFGALRRHPIAIPCLEHSRSLARYDEPCVESMPGAPCWLALR